MISSAFTYTIFVTRHGEREDVVNHLWARTALHKDDPPLADLGRQQARELGARLQSFKIDHIVSSPFKRCVETAHILAEMLDLPVKIEPGICEVLWDFPPGYLTPRELQSTKFPRVDVSYAPLLLPNSPESHDGDAIKRSAQVARELWQKLGANSTILFVGHGASCAGIVHGFTGKCFYQGICTLTTLGSNDGQIWTIAQKGDDSHLTDKTNLRAY